MEIKSNKLVFIFIFFFLIIISGFLVKAVTTETLEGVTEKIGELEEKTDSIRTKGDYLKEEWKTILLRNSIIVGIDNFFKKISPALNFLMGIPYEISLTFISVVFLWLVLWSVFYDWINYFGFFKKSISFIFSFLAIVSVANLGILKKIIDFLLKFIFSKEEFWARVILIVGIFLIILLFKYLSQFFGKYLKAKKEADGKELEKLNRTILGKVVEGITKF